MWVISENQTPCSVFACRGFIDFTKQKILLSYYYWEPSSVYIVTRLQVGHLIDRGSISGAGESLFSSPNVQTCSVAIPASHPGGTGIFYSEKERSECKSESSPLPSTNVKNAFSSKITPLFIFTSLCLIKQW